MDSYILTHIITLQDTLDNLRGEICTEFFLDLNIEKDHLKQELMEEVKTKNQAII